MVWLRRPAIFIPGLVSRHSSLEEPEFREPARIQTLQSVEGCAKMSRACAEDNQDVLPDEVLVSIFELLPRHLVLSSVAFVNRRFLRVATSKDLWLTRMAPALAQCFKSGGVQAAASWGAVFSSVYYSNLLSNPYLTPPLQAAQAGVGVGTWTVTTHGGSGWAWEPQPDMGSLPSNSAGPYTVPLPCPPFQTKVDQTMQRAPCAVASSYRWCELVQTVDLVEELQRRGLSREGAVQYLDASPPLSFSVWHAARADCPGECEARVILTGAASYSPTFAAAEDLASEEAGKQLPPHLANSAARLWGWTTGCVQPKAGRWQRACCIIVGYPPGARHCTVVLRGRDRRYWAGHWGAKLAAPSLHFLSPAELAEE